MIRRGATYPGKGERVEDVRQQLVSRILTERKRSVYEERIERLRERYQVKTWPERLR